MGGRYFYCTGAFVVSLPWTQNIRARGSVTTLRQEDRPQEMNAIIPGRIVKWYVKEGDFVAAGDTIAQLAEIKDEYLDPKLIERVADQINAKKCFYRCVSPIKYQLHEDR